MGTQHKSASSRFDPEHELFCHELWLRFIRIRDPRCKNILETFRSKNCMEMFLFYPGSWSLSHGTLWHGYYLRFAQTRDSHAEKTLEHVHHAKSRFNVFLTPGVESNHMTPFEGVYNWLVLLFEVPISKNLFGSFLWKIRFQCFFYLYTVKNKGVFRNEKKVYLLQPVTNPIFGVYDWSINDFFRFLWAKMAY